MGFISGAWKNTELICGNHGEDHSAVMTIRQGKEAAFYSCPHYDDKKECRCSNRLDVSDYEKMLTHIADTLIEADDDSTVLDLTGYRWKRKDVVFEILEFGGEKTVISVLNKKAIGK